MHRRLAPETPWTMRLDSMRSGFNNPAPDAAARAASHLHGAIVSTGHSGDHNW